MPQYVSKSKFKPKAFAYFRLVEEQRKEIYITDHGKPVLRISPVGDAEEQELEGLRGLVVSYKEPYEPVAEGEWDALR